MAQMGIFAGNQERLGLNTDERVISKNDEISAFLQDRNVNWSFLQYFGSFFDFFPRMH